MPSVEEIRGELAHPDSYPVRPAKVEIRETHISWVFLAGDRAYKLKKPLALEFVDYSTAARRREMCREEVRLNRRLAPDIYLGVRGVAPTDAGVELTDDDDPRAVEFVVEMRRYDERSTLAATLAAGTVEEEAVIMVGRRLAEFHRDAEPITVAAPVLEVQRRIERNLQELLGPIEEPILRDRVWALGTAAHAFIASHAETLVDRARRGLVREGHGDLRAEHVLTDGAVRVVDCVEFDPDLRRCDVSDDLAFLVSDLAAHGGERWGRVLVHGYRQAGGDPGDDELIAFYAAHRALIRAKVAFVRAGQLAAGSDERRAACVRGRSLIELADHFTWRARLPLVIIVCGVPASGKTSLARALADASGLAQVSSDPIRKQLAGIPDTERGAAEIYAPDWNARTYAELGRRAGQAVQANGGAIVDATFRHREDRESFARSFGTAAPVVFVECRAPAPVLRARAARRDRDPTRVSDAGHAVVERERSSWVELDEIPAAVHLLLRTDRRVQAAVAELAAVLDERSKRYVEA